jgi:ankyrin repeat protein
LSIANPEILAPLLDYADDLEIRDDYGWTPLMSAVNCGSKENVNMLLARGAHIDCDFSGGMSLIADAMNFNDPGKIHYLKLTNNVVFVLYIYIFRTYYDSY